MDDPRSELMAEILERLAAVENSRRAAYTTIRNGRLVVTNADGDEAIAFGMDESGNAFIRVMNSDGDAPAFEVSAGVSTFPLSASAWQPDYEFSGMDAQGRRTTTDTVVFQFMHHVVLSLVTPDVHYEFSPFASVGITQGQLKFTARALDARSDNGVHQVGSVISFNNSYPNIQAGTLTIPPDILQPQYDDVVGSIILLTASTRISGGTGTLAITPTAPAYCV